ncbi:uncharacterized protein LOC121912999 [Thunnus maccoyii]|uniref:uncharacterized protein LOC121912999 n=1 Tax=Thunnus maccoyii TaxID=8240 RepID=UPI001C4A9A06|nr:uncharacterized protein LOC121912999 [Thunnus maccoyii]
MGLLHRIVIRGRLSYHRACLSKTASRSKQCFISKNTWALFHGVLFGLLLVLTAVLPACVCLARAINTDGKQLRDRVIELWTNAGSSVDAPTVSFHHNLLGYFAIYSSVLWHRRAHVPEQITDPVDRSSATPFRRIAGLLFMPILLSGDVQLNPGPVTPGVLRNFDADLCSCMLMMNKQHLSEPGFSLNRLNFVYTRHDVSMNNFSLPGCGNLDRSSVSLTKPAADTTVCRNPAVRTQRLFKTFQTVNHAKVLWDLKLKPRGLFGGHFNIRRITAKSNQPTHLVSDSNLDFLCLTETWLKQTTPASVFTAP